MADSRLFILAADKNGFAEFKTLFEANPIDLDMEDEQSQLTLLELAAKSGSLQTVQFLIEEKNASLKTRGQDNLLFLARNNSNDVKTYLAQKHIVEQLQDGTDDEHRLAYLGDIEGVKALFSENLELMDYRNTNNLNPFDFAIAANQGEVIKYFLANGYASNKDYCYDESFFLALEFDRKEIIALMLDSNATLMSQLSPQGMNPLAYAADFACVGSVTALLDKGADPSIKISKGEFKGCNALACAIFACKEENITIVKLLLNAMKAKEKDPYIPMTGKFDEGLNPFQIAVVRGLLPLVKIFIEEFEANPMAEVPSGSSQGINALCLICIEPTMQGHEEVAKYLLDYLAKKEIKIFDTPITQGEYIDFTPLSLAAHYGRKDIVELFISRGANVFATLEGNCKGLNALTISFLQACKLKTENYFSLTKYLLEIYIKQDKNVVNSIIPSGTEKDYPLLMLAAKYNCLEMAKLLVQHGADRKLAIAQGPDEGSDPCYIATSHGNYEVLEYLLDTFIAKNEPLNYRLTTGSDKGSHLVFAAAYTGKLSILELLVNKGLDASFPVSKTNEDLAHFEGFTAIHIAAFKGYASIVSYLTKKVDFKQALTKARKGCTPLLLAVHNNDLKTVKILSDAGVNCDEVHSLQGGKLRPIYKAIEEKNHFIIVELLLGGACFDRFTPNFINAKNDPSFTLFCAKLSYGVILHRHLHAYKSGEKLDNKVISLETLIQEASSEKGKYLGHELEDQYKIAYLSYLIEIRVEVCETFIDNHVALSICNEQKTLLFQSIHELHKILKLSGMLQEDYESDAKSIVLERLEKARERTKEIFRKLLNVDKQPKQIPPVITQPKQASAPTQMASTSQPAVKVSKNKRKKRKSKIDTENAKKTAEKVRQETMLAHYQSNVEAVLKIKEDITDKTIGFLPDYQTFNVTILLPTQDEFDILLYELNENKGFNILEANDANKTIIISQFNTYLRHDLVAFFERLKLSPTVRRQAFCDGRLRQLQSSSVDLLAHLSLRSGSNPFELDIVFTDAKQFDKFSKLLFKQGVVFQLDPKKPLTFIISNLDKLDLRLLNNCLNELRNQLEATRFSIIKSQASLFTPASNVPSSEKKEKKKKHKNRPKKKPNQDTKPTKPKRVKDEHKPSAAQREGVIDIVKEVELRSQRYSRIRHNSDQATPAQPFSRRTEVEEQPILVPSETLEFDLSHYSRKRPPKRRLSRKKREENIHLCLKQLFSLLSKLSESHENKYLYHLFNKLFKLLEACYQDVDHLALDNVKKIQQLRNVICHDHYRFILKEIYHFSVLFQKSYLELGNANLDMATHCITALSFAIEKSHSIEKTILDYINDGIIEKGSVRLNDFWLPGLLTQSYQEIEAMLKEHTGQDTANLEVLMCLPDTHPESYGKLEFLILNLTQCLIDLHFIEKNHPLYWDIRNHIAHNIKPLEPIQISLFFRELFPHVRKVLKAKGIEVEKAMEPELQITRVKVSSQTYRATASPVLFPQPGIDTNEDDKDSMPGLEQRPMG